MQAIRNGSRYFKASSADHGTKIDVIQKNRHIYSVSALYKVLKMARSTFYYDTEISAKKAQKKANEEQKLKETILTIFNENANRHRQVAEGVRSGV